MPTNTLLINRAPVLALWAAVVAERMGFDPDAALSLGKAVTGLTAQSKGRRLGIYRPRMTEDGKPAPRRGLGEEFWVEVCGRPVPARNTDDGVRAVSRDKPVDPAAARRYLEQKFGPDLAVARAAMEALARSFQPVELADVAFRLYERFRPSIPAGKQGWGAKGRLDLDLVRSLRKR